MIDRAALVALTALLVVREWRHRDRLRAAEESRRRLVDASDDTRRGIERSMHDGVQQRLLSAVLTLRLARTRPSCDVPELLDEVATELATAVAELRELARSVHPVLLTDAGLAPALTALAARSDVAVELGELTALRFPRSVEQACYAVVAEAVAVAAGPGAAGEVSVDVRVLGRRLVLDVRDDGRGPRPELQESADRIAACGGRLWVTNGGLPGGGEGTRVLGELPCG